MCVRVEFLEIDPFDVCVCVRVELECEFEYGDNKCGDQPGGVCHARGVEKRSELRRE